MRLIDADVAKEWFKGGRMHMFSDDILNRIDHTPTIDAVPVVRCKDCALQGKLGCPMDEWVKPDDNGFCHHGKRKDGGS